MKRLHLGCPAQQMIQYYIYIYILNDFEYWRFLAQVGNFQSFMSAEVGA